MHQREPGGSAEMANREAYRAAIATDPRSLVRRIRNADHLTVAAILATEADDMQMYVGDAMRALLLQVTYELGAIIEDLEKAHGIEE